MMTEFIGFLIIIGALITVLIRRQTHSKRSEEDVFDGSEQLREQLEVTGDQIIRRVEAEVDALETLLAKADAKILLLDEKLLKLEQMQADAMPVAARPKALGNTFAALFDQALERDAFAANPMEDSVEIAEIKTVAVGADVPEKIVEEKIIPPRTREVFLLIEQGFSADEISKKTGLGKGAIDLIAEMHKSSNG